MKLTELIPDDNNANKGTERGRRELEKSLREHGWVEAGVLDKNNRIVGGNKRQEVAVDIGLPDDAIVIDHDGTKPIFVRLSNVDLDTPEGRKLAYRLNRVAQLDIDFDFDVIAQDLEDGIDLSGLWLESELSLDVEDYSDLDKELEDLAGFDEIDIRVTVPSMYHDQVMDWLANGESKTAPGLGKGVMRRCGLL